MENEDLILQFQEKLREELYGEQKHRTVEEALQEVLDDTTPEEAGWPKKSKQEGPPPDEWI